MKLKLYLILIILFSNSCIKKVQDNFFVPIKPRVLSISLDKTLYSVKESLLIDIQLQWYGNIEDDSKYDLNVNCYISQDTIIDSYDKRLITSEVVTKSQSRTTAYYTSFPSDTRTGNLYFIIESLIDNQILKRIFPVTISNEPLLVEIKKVSTLNDTLQSLTDYQITFDLESKSTSSTNLDFEYYLSSDTIFDYSTDKKIQSTNSSTSLNPDEKKLHIDKLPIPQFSDIESKKYLLIKARYNNIYLPQITKTIQIKKESKKGFRYAKALLPFHFNIK